MAKANRFKSDIPEAIRSGAAKPYSVGAPEDTTISDFDVRVLNVAKPKNDNPLYLVAFAVEQDAELTEEMEVWDSASGDGLDNSTADSW